MSSKIPIVHRVKNDQKRVRNYYERVNSADDRVDLGKAKEELSQVNIFLKIE